MRPGLHTAHEGRLAIAVAAISLVLAVSAQDALVSCIERRCTAYKAACLGSEGCSRCWNITQPIPRLQCEDALYVGDRHAYANLRHCSLVQCSPCASLASADDCLANTQCLWEAGACLDAELATPGPSGTLGRCCLSRTAACSQCTSLAEGWCAATQANCELSCAGVWCPAAPLDCTPPSDGWDVTHRDSCCTAEGQGCEAPSLQACGCSPGRPGALAGLNASYAGDVCVGDPQTWGAVCSLPDSTQGCGAGTCCTVAGARSNATLRCRAPPPPPGPASPTSGTMETCGCSLPNATTFVPLAYTGDVCVSQDTASRRVLCSYVMLSGRCTPGSMCCNANGYTPASRVCGTGSADITLKSSIRISLDAVMGTFRKEPFVEEVLASTRRVAVATSGVKGVRVEFICPSGSCCYGTQAERVAAGCALGVQCPNECLIDSLKPPPCLHNCTLFAEGDGGATLSPDYEGEVCQSPPQSWGSECRTLNSNGGCRETHSKCRRSLSPITGGVDPYSTGVVVSGHMTVEFSLILASEADRYVLTRHIIDEVNQGVLSEPLNIMRGSAVDVVSVYEGVNITSPSARGGGGDEACSTLCIVGFVVGIAVCLALVAATVLLYRRRAKKGRDGGKQRGKGKKGGAKGGTHAELSTPGGLDTLPPGSGHPAYRNVSCDSSASPLQLGGVQALAPPEFRILGSEVHMPQQQQQVQQSQQVPSVRAQDAYGEINQM